MTVYRSAGFTAIELVLAIGVLGIVAGILSPILISLMQRNDLDNAASTLVQQYRRAQTLARSSDGDASWGVSVGSTSITMFKGASFAVRDSAYDETTDISASVVPSGLLTVVFAKTTGVPYVTGTTTFTLASNDSKTIFLNAKGTITY